MTAEAQETHDAALEHGEHDDGHVRHPTPAQYWLIALALAAMTAVEISIPSIALFDGAPRVWLLLILGSAKFAVVVGFFMHLKFDKPLYRNFFLIGLFGAIAMFVVILLTFEAL